MIQSMTGFGRCQKTLGSRDITVEIKAVNHRYLEFSSRLPRSLGFIEDKLRGTGTVPDRPGQGGGFGHCGGAEGLCFPGYPQ